MGAAAEGNYEDKGKFEGSWLLDLRGDPARVKWDKHELDRTTPSWQPTPTTVPLLHG